MIPLIKSTFFHEEETKKKLCAFIAKAKHLSFGKECQEFEKKLALWQGRKDSIFVNSGSSANFAIIQALLNLKRIQRGDYVGFSSVTWSTNVMPLIQLGLHPVPVDVELNTLNVSSRSFISAIHKTPIKLMFLTNLLGFCGDIDVIQQICREKKIILIEDNCESMGTVYKKKKLGNFGSASTFSFYVGHHMSTIEGGAVCTDDERLATMLRLVRAHGWDRNLSFTKQIEIRKKFHVNSTFYSRYTFYDLGCNLRPTEIAGYVGQIQLRYVHQIIKKREQNFFYMSKIMYQKKDRFMPISYQHLDVVSNFAFPLICRSQEIRDDLVRRCEGKVEIRPIVGGDMTKQPFFQRYVNITQQCPNSTLIHNQGVYFGNNPELTREEMDYIINLFTSD